jgi:quinol monooxygenase YgiN
MILVIGTFRLPGENVERGCLAYSYAQDVVEPGLFRVSEAWTDRAALAAHFEAAHMKQWQRERAELGMTGREVTAYEASGEEAL